MTLLPGDLLATGTPPGVGFGKNRFTSAGDVLECGIAHLGAQRHGRSRGSGGDSSQKIPEDSPAIDLRHFLFLQ